MNNVLIPCGWKKATPQQKQILQAMLFTSHSPCQTHTNTLRKVPEWIRSLCRATTFGSLKNVLMDYSPENHKQKVGKQFKEPFLDFKVQYQVF